MLNSCESNLKKLKGAIQRTNHKRNCLSGKYNWQVNIYTKQHSLRIKNTKSQWRYQYLQL